MNSKDHITLFYGAKPYIFERAKFLRSNMTQEEKTLWEHLRGKKFLGLKFRAQHPIDVFIADFYCHSLRLVIEVDGEIHHHEENQEYDAGRTFELNEWGISVLRFSNKQVRENIGKVLNEIRDVCLNRKNAIF